MKIIVNQIAELENVSAELVSLMETYRIFLLSGDLGAGKTTLVKNWMKNLEVSDQVTSPTFSLVNHYKALETDIYHIDLYRLLSLEEAYNIGIEEYLDNQSCFLIVEWPNLILPLIGEPYVTISITEKNSIRSFDIDIHKMT